METEPRSQSMTTKIGIRLVLLIAIGATIGCDRVTKHVAATTLSGTPSRSFLADTVRLEVRRECGRFLESWCRLATPGTDRILQYWERAAVIRFGGHGDAASLAQTGTLLGVALFVAGGTSNLLDRITYGKVIDFMNVGLGPVRTGIFNVADMAIMLGAAIVVVGTYRSNGRAQMRGSA